MKKFRSDTLKIYKIRLESNRSVENAYRAYQTSWETEALDSEQGRCVYSELIDLDDDKKWEDSGDLSKEKSTKLASEKIDDDKSDDETQPQITIQNNEEHERWWTEISVETNRPKLLKEIAIESLGKQFSGRKIDERIFGDDEIKIGTLIDVELPIINLLDIDVNII